MEGVSQIIVCLSTKRTKNENVVALERQKDGKSEKFVEF